MANNGDIGNFLQNTTNQGVNSGLSYYNGLANIIGIGPGNSNNFSPSQAPINSGVTQGQINQSYDQSQQGLGQQQAFLQALQAQNGLGNQSNILGQQQTLAGQLQQQAMGQGPNPAQAMLANQTGQNVSQQAALMGGQRGASQNVGLMARQIGQQGAGIQQNAVGQAATMQAQQQIAAQQQLMAQQQAMQGVAGSQVSNQANALSNYNNAAQNQQQMLLNANAQYNNALQSGYNTNNQIGAGVASGNAAASRGLLGGITGALGSISSLKFADGGMVGYDGEGQAIQSGPQSQLGQMLNNSTQESNQMANAQPEAAQAMPQTSSDSKSSGGGLGLLALLSDGGHVPGKAQVKGNSRSNDTVPAMLSPGEIVIPRSALQGKNPRQSAITFLDAVLAKHKGPRR